MPVARLEPTSKDSGRRRIGHAMPSLRGRPEGLRYVFVMAQRLILA